MEAQIMRVVELVVPYILPAVFAIIIFIVGKWVARLVTRLLEKTMLNTKVDPTLVKFTCSIAYVALMAFVVLAALKKLGVETTSFVAILGAAGLAVGFALQGSLANFAAGVLMILFRPFKVGDYIEGAGTAGIVEEIQIFTTQLRTPDNKLVIVPNGKLTGDNLINYSAKDTRRIDLVIGVGYGDDLAKAKTVLEGVLAEEKRILEDPAASVGVLELGDSSVNLAVRPWVKTAEYWDVYFDLMETIKNRLDAEGISIPFPQRDVHIVNEAASPAA